MRYRLDDLGWFHFEQLIQSVLKAHLGLAVEAWGGSSSDLGRDAYCRVPLAFPDPRVKEVGPFLFQAKFVNSANAAGADWWPALSKAVNAEVRTIAKRRGTLWKKDPSHYVLLTNAALNSARRAAVDTAIQAALPATVVTSLGGTDVCALLDQHPALRRAFPEILGLRDLDALLGDVVNRDIVERSRAAIEETRDLVPVFVPTLAYRRAWDALRRNNFVVLDGPPEMGKTAIARTIALTLLLDGWEVIDCRSPSDFFQVLGKSERQLFVADDAFGRTEYNPLLGREWERDLPLVLRSLGPKCRLICTARRHILLRALHELDLTGRASTFPDPGETLVTADDLSIEEKARILYRHCRGAGLREGARQFVRESARRIVANKDFTPERIRRLANEVLPGITPKSADATALVDAAIRNPTVRMRKAFRQLPPEHKWVLAAMLDSEGRASCTTLPGTITRLFPASTEEAATEAVSDLIGTFFKAVGRSWASWSSGSKAGEWLAVDWIHPSYRDLVIEEVSQDGTMARSFLQRASAIGLRLALSDSGGGSGERRFPLLRSRAAWSALDERCRAIVSAEDEESVRDLLDVLANAMKASRSIPVETRARLERRPV